MTIFETRFTVRAEREPTRPGAWDGSVVAVLDRGEQIGSYRRNYPSFAEDTFAPFQLPDGRWMALYSPDYTCTRLLSLPGCEDVGGEPPDGCGFCPVELYVPAYRVGSYSMVHEWRAGQRVDPYVQRHETILWPGDEGEAAEFQRRAAEEAEAGPDTGKAHGFALSEVRWCPFGFVAGCFWGDDSSWKIEHLDLSRAGEGIVTRSDRFGYAEMPHNMRLRDAVDLRLWSPGRPLVGIARTDTHDLSRAPGGG